MKKPYIRKTEKRANHLIDQLLSTGNLQNFVEYVSEYSYYCGLYSRHPRDLFVEELKRQIHDRGIEIKR